MATAIISQAQSEQVALRRLWWVGPFAILGSIGANVAARAILGMLLPIPPEFHPLHYSQIIALTGGGVLGAVLTFAVIGRISRRPVQLFRLVAGVALLLSFVPDFGLLISQVVPGTNVLTVSLLMLLHVVPAIVSVGILTTLARD